MSFEDDKSGWSMNEPQLTIPMTNSDIVITKTSDKFFNSVIALNSLNSDDPILLPNALENGLVIELDREDIGNKKEILVIQNSNFKLQSCNSELENSASYNLPYIDQEKNEILWKGLLSKTTKSDFENQELQSNKAVAESSKTWQRELEETNSFISSTDKVISMTQNCGIEEKIILAVGEGNKKYIGSNNAFKDSYVTNSNSTLLSSLIQESNALNDFKPTEPKILVVPNENFQNINFNDSFKKISSNSNVKKKKLPLDFREISKNNMSKKSVEKEVLEFDIPNNCTKNSINGESLKKKLSVNKTLNINFNKSSLSYSKKLGNSDAGFNLPEKSLPLKKKAKMKTTIVSLISSKSEISKCLLKDKTICEDISNTNSKTKLKSFCVLKKSNELLKYKSKKKNKVNLIVNFDRGKALEEQTEQGKSFCQINNSLNKTENSNYEGRKFDINYKKYIFSKKLEYKTESNAKLNNIFPFSFDENNFNNIYDLVEGLRKCKIINSSLCKTLHSGLKEMDVDLLQEMRGKHGLQYLTNISSYSPQLKAFALVLYFKQPAAFHHLAKIYSNGWPSLSIIKEWKRKINCTKRTNYIH